VATLRELAKQLGRDHGLAVALWNTGVFEARMLTAFVDDPALVTPAQMDRWVKDFDNWAICDALCFHLFDRTPHAWTKVGVWSRRRGEFQKRAAFALLAGLALHDKAAPDGPFAKALPLIARSASDGRNYVKKGVSWALRAIGNRSPALNAKAIALSRRLVESKEPAARWVGRDALRELTGPIVQKRLRTRGVRRTPRRAPAGSRTRGRSA